MSFSLNNYIKKHNYGKEIRQAIVSRPKDYTAILNAFNQNEADYVRGHTATAFEAMQDYLTAKSYIQKYNLDEEKLAPTLKGFGYLIENEAEAKDKYGKYYSKALSAVRKAFKDNEYGNIKKEHEFFSKYPQVSVTGWENYYKYNEADPEDVKLKQSGLPSKSFYETYKKDDIEDVNRLKEGRPSKTAEGYIGKTTTIVNEMQKEYNDLQKYADDMYLYSKYPDKGLAMPKMPELKWFSAFGKYEADTAAKQDPVARKAKLVEQYTKQLEDSGFTGDAAAEADRMAQSQIDLESLETPKTQEEIEASLSKQYGANASMLLQGYGILKQLQSDIESGNVQPSQRALWTENNMLTGRNPSSYTDEEINALYPDEADRVKMRMMREQFKESESAAIEKAKTDFANREPDLGKLNKSAEWLDDMTDLNRMIMERDTALGSGNTNGVAQYDTDIKNLKAKMLNDTRYKPEMLPEQSIDLIDNYITTIKSNKELDSQIRALLPALNYTDTSDKGLQQFLVDVFHNPQYAEAMGFSELPVYKQIKTIGNSYNEAILTDSARLTAEDFIANDTIDPNTKFNKIIEAGYNSDVEGVTEAIKNEMMKPENLAIMTNYAYLNDDFKELVDYTISQFDFQKNENTLKDMDIIQAEVQSKISQLYNMKNMTTGNAQQDVERVKELTNSIMQMATQKYSAEQSIENAPGIDSLRGRQAYSWLERAGGGAGYVLGNVGLGVVDFGTSLYTTTKDVIKYGLIAPTAGLGEGIGASIATGREFSLDPSKLPEYSGIGQLSRGMDKGAKETAQYWNKQGDFTKRLAMARGGYNETVGFLGDSLRVTSNMLMTMGLMAATGGTGAVSSLPTAEYALQNAASPTLAMKILNGASTVLKAESLPIFANSYGMYKNQAVLEGAAEGDATIYALATGLAETMVEGPAFKNIMGSFGSKETAKIVFNNGTKQALKQLGTTQSKRFFLGLLEEAGEEMVIQPVQTFNAKMTYDPSVPWTGKGGVFDPEAILQAGTSALLPTALIGVGITLPTNVKAYNTAKSALTQIDEISAKMRGGLVDQKKAEVLLANLVQNVLPSLPDEVQEAMKDPQVSQAVIDNVMASGGEFEMTVQPAIDKAITASEDYMKSIVVAQTTQNPDVAARAKVNLDYAKHDLEVVMKNVAKKFTPKAAQIVDSTPNKAYIGVEKEGVGNGNILRGVAGEVYTGSNGETGIKPGGSGTTGGRVLLNLPDKQINVENVNPVYESEHGVFYDVTTKAQEFYEMIGDAKANNQHGAYVTQYAPEEYANKKLYVSNDGTSGVAVTDDGDIVSVFKNEKLNTKKGVSTSLLITALKNGGIKLDAFDGFLSTMYQDHGFIPVARVAFNEEFAPEGWNYERDGKPDIVFYVHNGNTADQVAQKVGTYKVKNIKDVRMFNSYEDAQQFRDGLIEKVKKKTGKLQPQNKAGERSVPLKTESTETSDTIEMSMSELKTMLEQDGVPVDKAIAKLADIEKQVEAIGQDEIPYKNLRKELVEKGITKKSREQVNKIINDLRQNKADAENKAIGREVGLIKKVREELLKQIDKLEKEKATLKEKAKTDIADAKADTKERMRAEMQTKTDVLDAQIVNLQLKLKKAEQTSRERIEKLRAAQRIRKPRERLLNTVEKLRKTYNQKATTKLQAGMKEAFEGFFDIAGIDPKTKAKLKDLPGVVSAVYNIRDALKKYSYGMEEKILLNGKRRVNKKIVETTIEDDSNEAVKTIADALDDVIAKPYSELTKEDFDVLNDAANMLIVFNSKEYKDLVNKRREVETTAIDGISRALDKRTDVKNDEATKLGLFSYMGGMASERYGDLIQYTLLNGDKSNPAFKVLMGDINKASETQKHYNYNDLQYFKKNTEGIKWDKWSGEKAPKYEFKLEDGTTTELNLGDLFNVFIMSLNQQSRNALMNGVNFKMWKKGKALRSNRVTMSEGDIDRIASVFASVQFSENMELSDVYSALKIVGPLADADVQNVQSSIGGELNRARKYAEALLRFYNDETYTNEYEQQIDTAKTRVNKASRAALGYDIANVEIYAPLFAEGNTISRSNFASMGRTLEGSGWTKQRKTRTGAKYQTIDPRMLFAQSADETAMYAGWLYPVKVLKHVFGNADVKQKLQSKFGHKFMPVISDFIQRFDGDDPTKPQGFGMGIMKLTTTLKSAVMKNPFLWVIQPIAVVYATDTIGEQYMLNPKAALKLFTDKEFRQNMKRAMVMYAPEAAMREYGDIRSAVNEYTEATNPVKGMGKGVIMGDKVATWMIAGSSYNKASILTKRAVAEMQKQGKTVSQAKIDEMIWKKTGEILNEAQRTQPSVDPYLRSYMGNQTDALTRLFTAFTGESNVMWNTMKNGVRDIVSKDKKRMASGARKLLSAALSATIYTLAVYGRQKWRRDEKSDEQFLLNLVMNMFGNMYGISMVTGGIVQGREFGLILESAINDLITPTSNMYKNTISEPNKKYSPWKDIKQIIMGMSQFVGVPVSALERDYIKPTLKTIGWDVMDSYNRIWGKVDASTYYPEYARAIKDNGIAEAEEIAWLLVEYGSKVSNWENSKWYQGLSPEQQKIALDAYNKAKKDGAAFESKKINEKDNKPKTSMVTPLKTFDVEKALEAYRQKYAAK